MSTLQRKFPARLRIANRVRVNDHFSGVTKVTSGFTRLCEVFSFIPWVFYNDCVFLVTDDDSLELKTF